MAQGFLSDSLDPAGARFLKAHSQTAAIDCDGASMGNCTVE